MQDINFLRCTLLMISAGIALAILIQLAKWILASLSIDISPFVLGGGVFGAGMAAAVITISKGVRNGHCKWLLKNQY